MQIRIDSRSKLPHYVTGPQNTMCNHRSLEISLSHLSYLFYCLHMIILNEYYRKRIRGFGLVHDKYKSPGK